MTCDLTVIVAHTDAAAPLNSCVAALDRACSDLHAELVIVESANVPSRPAPACAVPLTLIRVGGSPLVPQLWAQGVRVARGEYVAFTLANCKVSEEWARSLIVGFQEGAAGVAGPIECEAGARLVDRALYYLRYSAFMPSQVTNGMVPGEIPGDNAAYSRETLHKHRDVIADGFWEVVFHRRLRRDGGRLCMQRNASARFCGGVAFRDAIRHRFAHGRHFGAWRVAQGHRRRWQIGAAAPVVPLLLAFRAGSRVMRSAAHRGRFVAVLPMFLVIAAAWALGEAVGALRGAGLPEISAADRDVRTYGQDTANSSAAVAR